MSDAYAWFKFNCASWMMGRIRRLSFAHQGAFIGLCSVYWTKFGEVSLEDAEIECTEELLPDLLKTKIVKVEGEKIRIGFLDEQLDEAKGKSRQSKEAAKVRWDNARNATALQPHSERNAEREKERKKEVKNIEERKKLFYEQVGKFASQYQKDLLRAFFDYWTEVNKKGDKLRFEDQKYFEIGKRLGTWSRNNKDKYGSGNSKESGKSMMDSLKTI